MRFFYRCLLALHPPAFRRKFAGQMLSIFDEPAASPDRMRLLFDAILSLARQWLLRRPAVLLGLGAAGATLQAALITAMCRFSQLPLKSGSSAARPVATLDPLYLLVACTAAATVAMVFIASVCLSFHLIRAIAPSTTPCMRKENR